MTAGGYPYPPSLGRSSRWCLLHFVRTHLSLTGLPVRCIPHCGRSPLPLGRSSRWCLLHFVRTHLSLTGLPVHFYLRRMPHRGTIHLRPPRSPRRKAQVHRKARTRFAGESRNCFPRTWALRQGMKIAVRFSIIPLRPSGAVQDGMHRTSFVRAYPSLGFRLAASPTGRARLRPAKPLNEDGKQRVCPLCTPPAILDSILLCTQFDHVALRLVLTAYCPALPGNSDE